MNHSQERKLKTKEKTARAAILASSLLLALLMMPPALGVLADNGKSSSKSGTVEPAIIKNMMQSPPVIITRKGTSENWAGYAAESKISSPASQFIKSVKGSWVVPSVKCDSTTTNAYSSAWVGIDGYSDRTVEQTGTEQDCINGAPRYYAWYEMYPQLPRTRGTGITVNPGDTITASVTYIGNNKFTLSMTDYNPSTGQTQSFSKTASLHAQRSSAEWIVEAPSSFFGVLPLANFGTVSFSNAQYQDNRGTTYAIDGRGTGTFDAITMHDPQGGNAKPSALRDSGTSSGFDVKYSP